MWRLWCNVFHKGDMCFKINSFRKKNISSRRCESRILGGVGATLIEDPLAYFACDNLATSSIQYIPRNMHTVFALLCFVVVIPWLIFPYPSGLLHWHCGNLTIAPVPAKQPWRIWINTSCEFIMNDCITTTKQSTTKPCAYFLGYTVYIARFWDLFIEQGGLYCNRGFICSIKPGVVASWILFYISRAWHTWYQLYFLLNIFCQLPEN